MAILEQVVVPAQTAQTANRRPFNGVIIDRPRAKVWGNYGIMVNGEFIPAPLGSAIDTMEPASTTGQNAPVVRLNHGKNRFLAALQAIGADMKPGETKFIPNIVFQLRRVNEDLELVKTETELDVGDIVNLLTPKTEPSGVVEPTKSSVDKASMQAQLEALQKALSASE